MAGWADLFGFGCGGNCKDPCDGDSGDGGGTLLPECFCRTPCTLAMTSLNEGENYGMFRSCTLQHTRLPWHLTAPGATANGYISTESFTDSLSGLSFYYYFWCRYNQFFLTRVFPNFPDGTPEGSPLRDGILYSWIAGGYGNQCEPLRLQCGKGFPGNNDNSSRVGINAPADVCTPTNPGPNPPAFPLPPQQPCFGGDGSTPPLRQEPAQPAPQLNSASGYDPGEDPATIYYAARYQPPGGYTDDDVPPPSDDGQLSQMAGPPLVTLAPPIPARRDPAVVRAIGSCPDRGGVLPLAQQADCGCAGLELSECRAGVIGRGGAGRVTTRDCYACRAATLAPAPLPSP